MDPRRSRSGAGRDALRDDDRSRVPDAVAPERADAGRAVDRRRAHGDQLRPQPRPLRRRRCLPARASCPDRARSGRTDVEAACRPRGRSRSNAGPRRSPAWWPNGWCGTTGSEEGHRVTYGLTILSLVLKLWSLWHRQKRPRAGGRPGARRGRRLRPVQGDLPPVHRSRRATRCRVRHHQAWLAGREARRL